MVVYRSAGRHGAGRAEAVDCAKAVDCTEAVYEASVLCMISSNTSRAIDFPKHQRILAVSAPGKEGSGGFFLMGEWPTCGKDGAIMAIMVMQPKIRKSEDTCKRFENQWHDPRRTQYKVYGEQTGDQNPNKNPKNKQDVQPKRHTRGVRREL
jgi:hypothetical protein